MASNLASPMSEPERRPHRPSRSRPLPRFAGSEEILAVESATSFSPWHPRCLACLVWLRQVSCCWYEL